MYPSASQIYRVRRDAIKTEVLNLLRPNEIKRVYDAETRLNPKRAGWGRNPPPPPVFLLYLSYLLIFHAEIL